MMWWGVLFLAAAVAGGRAPVPLALGQSGGAEAANGTAVPWLAPHLPRGVPGLWPANGSVDGAVEFVEIGQVDKTADKLYQSLQGTFLGLWVIWLYYLVFYSKQYSSNPDHRQTASEVYHVVSLDLERHVKTMQAEGDQDSANRWRFWADMSFGELGDKLEELRKEEAEASRSRSYGQGWKAAFILDMTTHRQRLMQALFEEDPYNFDPKRAANQPVLTAVMSTNLLGHEATQWDQRFLSMHDAVVISPDEPWKQLNAYPAALSEFIRHLTGEPFSITASIADLANNFPEASDVFEPIDLIPMLLKAGVEEVGEITKDSLSAAVLHAHVSRVAGDFYLMTYKRQGTQLEERGLCGLEVSCLQRLDADEASDCLVYQPEYLRFETEDSSPPAQRSAQVASDVLFEWDKSIDRARLQKLIATATADDGSLCITAPSVYAAFAALLRFADKTTAGKMQEVARRRVTAAIKKKKDEEEERWQGIAEPMIKHVNEALKGGRLLPLTLADYHVYARPKAEWDAHKQDMWPQVMMLLWDALGGTVVPKGHTERLQEVVVAKLLAERQPRDTEKPVPLNWRDMSSWNKVIHATSERLNVPLAVGVHSTADEPTWKGGLKIDNSIKSSQGANACFQDRIDTSTFQIKIGDSDTHLYAAFVEPCHALQDALRLLRSRMCRVKDTTTELAGAVRKLGMTKKQFNWWSAGPTVTVKLKDHWVRRHITLAELLEDKKFRVEDTKEAMGYVKAMALGNAETMEVMSLVVPYVDMCHWMSQSFEETKLDRFVRSKAGLLGLWGPFKRDAAQLAAYVENAQRTGDDHAYNCGHAIGTGREREKVSTFHEGLQCWVSSTARLENGKLIVQGFHNMLKVEDTRSPLRQDTVKKPNSADLRPFEPPMLKMSDQHKDNLLDEYKDGNCIAAEVWVDAWNSWCAATVRRADPSADKVSYTLVGDKSLWPKLKDIPEKLVNTDYVRPRPSSRHGQYTCNVVDCAE